MVQHDLIGHQVICSAFIEKNNKFLIVFCPKFKVWRVPGGRTEWGERLETTLLREMEEEVGVRFENPRFIGFGQDEQFLIQKDLECSRLIMFYHLKTDEELTLDPREAIDHKWVTLEEIKRLEKKKVRSPICLQEIQIFNSKLPSSNKQFCPTHWSFELFFNNWDELIDRNHEGQW